MCVRGALVAKVDRSRASRRGLRVGGRRRLVCEGAEVPFSVVGAGVQVRGWEGAVDEQRFTGSDLTKHVRRDEAGGVDAVGDGSAGAGEVE